MTSTKYLFKSSLVIVFEMVSIFTLDRVAPIRVPLSFVWKKKQKKVKVIAIIKGPIHVWKRKVE